MRSHANYCEMPHNAMRQQTTALQRLAMAVRLTKGARSWTAAVLFPQPTELAAAAVNLYCLSDA